MGRWRVEGRTLAATPRLTKVHQYPCTRWIASRPASNGDDSTRHAVWSPLTDVWAQARLWVRLTTAPVGAVGHTDLWGKGPQSELGEGQQNPMVWSRGQGRAVAPCLESCRVAERRGRTRRGREACEGHQPPSCLVPMRSVLRGHPAAQNAANPNPLGQGSPALSAGTPPHARHRSRA